MKQSISHTKVYVGCGEDRREGFSHCDLRALDGIDIVCKAWELSQHTKNVEDIYSRHMLEHLTSLEVTATLKDWFNSLSVGGRIYIVVPNLDFHINQWLNAEWNESTAEDQKSNAIYGLAGIYGWQRECDPKEPDYAPNYWDVHKTGFNQKRMQYLLEITGFDNINIIIKNNVHLVATAEKLRKKA